MADDILRQGVQGITDLITVPGPRQPRLRRRAHDHARRRLGADGHRRRLAARTARPRPRARRSRRRCSSTSLDGATGILLNITGGPDLGLFEVNEAAEVVTERRRPERERHLRRRRSTSRMGDEVRVTVIATGFGGSARGVAGVEATAGVGASASGRRSTRRASATSRSTSRLPARTDVSLAQRNPLRRTSGPRRSLKAAASQPRRSEPSTLRRSRPLESRPWQRRSCARRSTSATSRSARAWCRSPAGRCPCSTRA